MAQLEKDRSCQEYDWISLCNGGFFEEDHTKLQI